MRLERGSTPHLLIAVVALVAVGGAAQAAAQRDGAPLPDGRRQISPPRDPAQTPANVPRGTAVIRGVVLAADTGIPIRRAQVRVTASGAGSRLATTDAQGRFEFRELVAARYTVSVSKGGFVGLQYGQRRPSEAGTPIELSDAQVVEKLVVALPRGSVISGRVFDEFGEPVANAVVTALRYGYAGGTRRFVAGGQNARDTTDDQGAFRLFGLQPGEYIVAANFRGGGRDVTDTMDDVSGFAPTYFPGTPSSADAQRIRVEVSQEQSGINFALIAAKLVRISGSVLDSQGAVVTNAAVMLLPADRSAGPLMVQNTTRVNRSGAFQLTNVPPGRFLLQVRTNTGGRGGRGGPPAPGGAPDAEFGRLEIAVGAQDMDGVVIVTAPGARVAGQVVSDTGQPLPIRPEQVQIVARAARADQSAMPGGGGGMSTRPVADWTFQLQALFDAAVLRVNTPRGWWLKQVLVDGQDVTDAPLAFAPGQTVAGVQVVLTDKSGTVQGAVTDERGNLMTDATILVFPGDENLWTYQSRFIRSGRPNQEGRYEIGGLPPYDDYLIVAVQGLEDGQAGDPDYLGRVKPLAARLSLKEGETKTADVKLSGR